MQKPFYIYILIGLSWSACHQVTEYPKAKQASYVSRSVSHPVTDIRKVDTEVDESSDYAWYTRLKPQNMLLNRVPTPAGYERIPLEKGSFGDWLRHLPIKADKADVYYYNDEPKETQSIHEAVLDIDIGDKDLQKSEDAILRLYMEYLFSKKKFDKIFFEPSPTDTFSFLKVKTTTNYATFRKYLNELAIVSTPYSLLENMEYAEMTDIKVGQVFVQPNEPGHAAMVIDIAQNEVGQRIFLLAQAFSPAQDIHILKNFRHETPLSPWYPANFGISLYTPEWEFTTSDLMEFKFD